ncbi:MAG: hypothetical protein AB7E80_17125 [Hyphomicrobiaceae bacterium]
MRGWSTTRAQACTTVVDAALFPGDRPRERQKCATYDMVDFTVMCRGGAVSAARWTAATHSQSDRSFQLDGDRLVVTLKGGSGWGGLPRRGFSGLTLAQGGTSAAYLPPGLGFNPRLNLHQVALPWREFVSGQAMAIDALTASPPPPAVAVPGWVRMLQTLWPWPQLVIGIPALIYAFVAAFGVQQNASLGGMTLAIVAVLALIGLSYSKLPATLPQLEIERVRQSARAAEQQLAQAERDRAALRQIIRVSDATGMVEPVSADDVQRAKSMMGKRTIRPATHQPADPTFWAAASLLPSLVLFVLFVPAFVRGWHYLFVPHPAGPVVAPALSRGELFEKRKLGAALQPDSRQLQHHPPAYQTRNLLEKAVVLKDKIIADAEIAEAAMRRDLARAQQIEAEAELRAARRRLPWWKRWMV